MRRFDFWRTTAPGTIAKFTARITSPANLHIRMLGAFTVTLPEDTQKKVQTLLRIRSCFPQWGIGAQ
jgi:hypothetical protein